MRGAKREVGVSDFQSGCEIQGRGRISGSGDRDWGAKLVSLPKLDTLDHEALLSKYAAITERKYMSFQLVCQRYRRFEIYPRTSQAALSPFISVRSGCEFR